MFRVIVESSASADIESIYRHIAFDSPMDAGGWVEQIEQAVQSLACFPRRCRLAPENNVFRETIRQQVVGNYRVLFGFAAMRCMCCT